MERLGWGSEKFVKQSPPQANVDCFPVAGITKVFILVYDCFVVGGVFHSLLRWVREDVMKIFGAGQCRRSPGGLAVTWSKVLNLLEPHFLACKMGFNSAPLRSRISKILRLWVSFPGIGEEPGVSAGPPGGTAGPRDHLEKVVSWKLCRDLPAGVFLRPLSDGPDSGGDP